MEREHLKLVIVGHVDHGKSTLIGRLFYDTDSLPREKLEEVRQICEALGRELEFAFVMDHLEEERSQGITIDTAQTFFKTAKRDYVIIDAPGHREFTKNMITGASQAEAAILIVDVSEGVQEQTRRHAYILSMLGLKQVIVVLNKMDLVGYSEEVFEKVRGHTLDFLKRIGINPTYVIPISAREGDNVASRSERMPWYTGPTILEALDTFKKTERRDGGPLRFAVQDVYNIEGKRIIVGRVEAGTLRRGDEIVILPTGERTRVKSIEEFMREGVEEAPPGKSTGITLEDKLFVDRGQILCRLEEETPKMVSEVKGSIFWMSSEPLQVGESVIFKCSTQEAPCRVEAIERRIDSSTLEVIEENSSRLENREVGEVTLSFASPVIVEDFNVTPELGRFVIEKEGNISGGGIITRLEG
ncbi:MAG: 50S ribosome-binding GTPase [Thermoplasmata archaeon]|nr:50S ribosome-binding GTPase [Thermoplasmata archaeon]